MRITVLKRGGLSVYGGSYDPRRQAAIAETTQQQTVEIIFPSTITAITSSPSGISASTSAISDNKATFTISGPGSLELVATMGSERPKVRIEAETYGHTDYGTA